MSLEPSSFPALGLTGSKDLCSKLGLRSSRSHKTRYSEARVSENRSKVSNKSRESRKCESHKSDKSASTRHTSTVCTMSSSEKRHELALVKRRHEELERQYQVSMRLKEQEKVVTVQLTELAESRQNVYLAELCHWRKSSE